MSLQSSLSTNLFLGCGAHLGDCFSRRKWSSFEKKVVLQRQLHSDRPIYFCNKAKFCDTAPHKGAFMFAKYLILGLLVPVIASAHTLLQCEINNKQTLIIDLRDKKISLKSTSNEDEFVVLAFDAIHLPYEYSFSAKLGLTAIDGITHLEADAIPPKVSLKFLNHEQTQPKVFCVEKELATTATELIQELSEVMAMTWDETKIEDLTRTIKHYEMKITQGFRPDPEDAKRIEAISNEQVEPILLKARENANSFQVGQHPVVRMRNGNRIVFYEDNQDDLTKQQALRAYAKGLEEIRERLIVLSKKMAFPGLLWSCTAVCETHRNDIQHREPGFIENVAVDLKVRNEMIKTLAKYRSEISSSSETKETAFSRLQFSCLDIASGNDDEIYLGTPYAPKLLDGISLEIVKSADTVCHMDFGH